MWTRICQTLFLLFVVAPMPATAWQAMLAGTPPDARPFSLGVDALGNVYTGGRTPNVAGTNDGIVARLAALDGTIVWQRLVTGSGPGDHIVRAIVIDAAGDAIAIGQVTNAATKADAFVAKLAAGDGHDLWRLDLDGGTNGTDDARAGALLAGGDVVVAGSSPKPGVPGSLAVWRLGAATGAAVWTTRLPASGGVGQRVAVTADAVFVGAHVPTGGGTQLTVSRLAATDGAVAWSVPVAGTGAPVDELTGLAAGSGDTVMLSARVGDGAGGGTFVVAALDAATGAERWRTTLDGMAGGATDQDAARALAVDGAGAPVAAGVLTAANGEDDVVVVKLDPDDGSEQWRATPMGSVPDSDDVRDVAVDGAGDVVIAARLRNLGTNRDLAAVKIDGATGAPRWSESINGQSDGSDTAFAVAVDPAGHVAVAGRLRNGDTADGYAVLRLSGPGGGSFPCGDGVPDPGEACDDGNPIAGDGCRNDCTLEVCGDGRLDPGEACDDGAPETGCCSDACTPEADGHACDDADACTTVDHCVGGACVGTQPIVCPLAPPCQVGRCDALTGTCATDPLADDSRCDDGDPCSGDDRCLGGTCLAGAPVTCADTDPCTLDQCAAGSGCEHPDVGGFASVLCVFERTTIAAICPDPLPGPITKRLQKTQALLARADEDATAARAGAACRTLARAGRAARKTQRLAGRQGDRGRLPFDCGRAIVDEMIYLRARVTVLRGEQC